MDFLFFILFVCFSIEISESLINNSAVDVIKQMLTGDPKERISSSGVKRQLNEIKVTIILCV